jgi:predicted outer membrane repeat protein
MNPSRSIAKPLGLFLFTASLVVTLGCKNVMGPDLGPGPGSSAGPGSPALGGWVSITGSPIVGETLTAEVTFLSAGGSISYSYQGAGPFPPEGLHPGRLSASWTEPQPSSGGGIWSVDGGTLSISSGTISLNEANGGGGIFSDSGSISITGKTFISGNTAGERGGGIYVSSDSSFTKTSSRIDGGPGDGDQSPVNRVLYEMPP